MSRPIEAGALATSGTIGKCREEAVGSLKISVTPQSVPNGKCREENECSLNISV